LDRYSAPLPDVALLRPKTDFYSEAHPEPEDVLLLVEVADSSLSWDRTVKARLYAETGIAEYWLLDVRGDVLIVHSDLQGGIYESVSILRRGETVAPKRLSAFRFTVDEILGEPNS
jgi:Uma2 family endonuclease